VRTSCTDNIGGSNHLDPGVRMVGEESVDRGHILNKLGAIPLSTEPLQAQQRMAPQAD